MKTWDDWSNHDIDCAVAKALGYKPYYKEGYRINGGCCVVSNESPMYQGVYAPSSDWSVMGRLIDKHGIQLSSTQCPAGSGLVFTACSNDRIHQAPWSDTYCRAAAIVFLMMNGVRPDE